MSVSRRASGSPSGADMSRLLLENARWRARDANTAVGDLLSDGKVRAEPPGRRLTKASVIRLR